MKTKINRLVACVAVFACWFGVSSVLAETADKNCLRWQFPGGDVNQRTLQKTIEDMKPETAVEKQKLEEIFPKTVVTIDQVKEKLAAQSLSEDEEKRILAIFTKTKKQFWAIEKIAEMQIPNELKQSLGTLVEPALYESRKVTKGFRIEGLFLFGQREARQCVVFDPAQGQPQEVVFHILTIPVNQEGETREYFHSTICSNMGKNDKRVSRPAPKPAVAPTPPPVVATFAIDLWSRSLSAPEGQKLLDELTSDPTTKRFKRQSRDLGDRILEAAAEQPPKVMRVPGCAKFRFIPHGMKLDVFRGSTIWINGGPWSVPNDYDPARGIEVQVCEGTEGGWIAVPENPAWNADGLSWTIESPFKAPVIKYPRSGSLKECGPATEAVCASKGYAGERTEMSRRIEKVFSEFEPRHYHFVVR